jgi:hypothetical protein
VAARMTELYSWKMRCDRCGLVIAGHSAKAKGWWRCLEADTIRLNPIDICAECWKEMWEQAYERRRDRLQNRTAKVLQLHPREADRFSIVRDGSRIQITIECNCDYSAMLVFDQAIDYLQDGELVLGVKTHPMRRT